MTTKSTVTKFFDDNTSRISPRTDPVAHNTNAGLLALVGYLSTEFSQVNSRLDELELRIRRMS